MKELEPVIQQIIDIIKSTQAFTVAQAPEFIRQFMRFCFWIDIIRITIPIILITLIIKLRSKIADYHEEWLIVMAFVIIAFLTIYFIVGSCDLFELEIAPKVWIVENLRDILKN